MLRRRVPAVLLTVGLACTGAACGDDGESAVQPALLTLTYEGTTDTDALEVAVTARLESIGIVVEAVDADTPGQVEIALEDDRLDELSADLLTQQGVLRVRPVLSATEGGQAADIPATDTGTEPADQEVTLPQVAEDGATAFTLRLGPAVVDGGAVESAAALEGDTGTELQVVFQQAALEELNTAAALCFAKAETCPTGQLAFAVDGRVLAAPTVEQPGFAADEIVISPRLEDLALQRLATVLTSGPLPVLLTRA